MNIKSLHIEQFGPYTDWTFQAGAKGTQFIYGPNESGKTTLLEAIRLMLLGGKHRKYEDIAASMTLERNGEGFYLGRHKKKLDFHPLEGESIKTEPSKLWWHGLDKKTYNRIFAITLDDLQGLDILKEVDVRTRFFGAEGGEAISEAVKDLDKSSQELLVGSANGKRKINVILDQLEDNRKRLAELSRQESAYVELGHELDQLDQQEGELNERLADRRDYHTGIDMALRAWDTYRRAEEARRHMDSFKDGEPVDGEYFTKLEEEIDNARDQMRMWKGREEALVPDNFDPKSPLGVYESDIERLYSKVGQWDQWVQEYEQGEAYIANVKSQLDNFRTHCSTWRGDQEWASHIDWQQGEVLARQVALARQQYEEARVQQVVFPGGDPLGTADLDSLAAASSSTASNLGSDQDLEGESIQHRPIKELKGERKEVIQALQDVKYDSSHELYAGLGLGGLVLSAIMVALGLMIVLLPLTIVGAILAAIALGILVFGLLKKKRRSHKLASLSSQIDQYDALIETAQAAKEAEKEAAKAAPKIALEVLQKALEDALHAWRTWLPQGAVESTDETGLFLLRDEYTKYFDQRRTYEDQVHQLKNYGEKIKDMEVVVADLWKHIGYDGETTPVALKKVYAMLRNFQQNRIRWEQKESQRNSYHKEYTKYARLEQDLLFKQGEFLTRHGMKTAMEFRQKLLDQEQYKQWEKIYDQSMDHLRLLAPEGETEGLFIRRLHGQKKVDLQAALDRSGRDLVDLEGQLAELYERRGQITESMRILVDDQAFQEALQEKANLEGLLEEALEEWATQVFIAHCMEGAQGRYEQHKQPQMLAKASDYVNRLTGGKYTLHMSQEGDVFAVDQKGRRLESQHWSSGLGDQVYLALRLALAELFSQSVEPLPIILDDILVRFDVDRQRQALAVLAELGAKQQVIILSCQQDLLHMAQGMEGIDCFQLTKREALAL